MCSLVRRVSPGVVSVLAAATFGLMACWSKPVAACGGAFVRQIRPDVGDEKSTLSDASMVAIYRDKTHTVLSLAMNYKGPLKDFALVVPVPVVLQKNDVKTLPASVFGELDRLTAPQLVEEDELDPCKPEPDGRRVVGSPKPAVKVEAEFSVGEYDVVVLSGEESVGLEAWLKAHKFAVPNGIATALAPYVKEQSKFFVAKVDPMKIAAGKFLSPLQFSYESTDLRLPIRLGLVNGATQDLLVFGLSASTRFEAANMPNLFVLSGLEVAEKVKGTFGDFYNALFDRTLKDAGNKGAVIEFAGLGNTLSVSTQQYLSGETSQTKSRAVRDRYQARGDIPSNSKRFFLAEMAKIERCVPLRVGMTSKVHIEVEVDASGLVNKTIVTAPEDVAEQACIVAALKNVDTHVRPDKGKPMSYEADLDLTLDNVRSNPLILTRMHLRYDAATLVDDLVLKAADPIQVGPDGKPKNSLYNDYRARYRILHRFEGRATCDEPRRGRYKPRTEITFAVGLSELARTAVNVDGLIAAKSLMSDGKNNSIATAEPHSSDKKIETSSRTNCSCGTPGMGNPQSRWTSLLWLWGMAVVTRRRHV